MKAAPRSLRARGGLPSTGWPAVFFGLPFIAAGAAQLAMAAGYIDAGGGRAPLEILWATGSVFAGAGLLVSGQGVRGLAAARRRRRLRAEHRGQPWLWDRDWDLVVRDDGVSRTASSFLWGAFMTVFMVPFNWWAWFSADGVLPVKLITTLFDVLALGMLGHGFYQLGRGLKYGISRLALPSVPLRLGSRPTVKLEAADRIEGRLAASLRCVEERVVRDGSGSKTTTRVECFVLHEKAWTVDRSAAGADVNLTLELPADAPPTDLGVHPPRYWELELAAETPGIDYHAVFLLPVY